jgi:RNA polymerase sigma-70 factor (ECF subfamily)
MGAVALAWAGRAVTDAVPVVRGLEPFDRFYAREFPKMVSIGYALSGGRMAAEDPAQEAMTATYRRRPEVGLLERPGGWARRVVLNLAASAYQRRKAEARALLRLALLRSEPPVELSAEAGEFWHAVRRLPKHQAQAVTLHYLEDASVAEIAGVMGCAAGTVKVHLHRGRQALAEWLHVEEW